MTAAGWGVLFLIFRGWSQDDTMLALLVTKATQIQFVVLHYTLAASDESILEGLWAGEGLSNVMAKTRILRGMSLRMILMCV
jgi:hypothetical protein